MQRIVFLAVILLSITFGVSAQSGRITGKVTYGDGVSLHDAAVQITQTKATAVTNTDGVYEFVDVPPGRYTVLVHLEGFADAAKPVEVTAGTTVTVDFQMQIRSVTEQVTVTASGTEQSVFDSFQTVNSVGATRIAERGATSLGEALDTETGVAKRSFGPGASRPVIRGFDGDRVLVLQDGIRVGSVGSQSGDHGEPIDPLSAERIEVVKGPGTLLYGSNALGGVVNVIGSDEDDAHEGIRGFFNAVGSSADRQAGAAGNIEYGVNNFLFRANLSAQRTGDYSTPIGRIPNSSTRSNTGSFGVGYYSSKAYLAGTYGFDLRRYGVPFAALFEEPKSPEGDLPVLDEEIDLRQRRHNFRVKAGLRDLTNPLVQRVQLNLDYSDYRHKEIETADGFDAVGTIFDNTTLSFRSLFEQTRHGRLTGRFGFEGFNRDYVVNGEEQLIEGKIKHNALAFYALEELDLEGVKIQFGGRIENNRYSPENPELPKRSFTAFSGGAGINVGLWKGGAIILNYTHSNRAPALEELYNNGPHIGNVTFEIGNEDLRRETSNGIDVSLRHQSRRFRFTGDVYYYRIDNFVFLAPQDADGDGQIDTIDGLPVAKYSQSDASYLGAEMNAEITFNNYIGLFLSLDAVRARLLDSVDLPRIPPARAKFGLDLHYKDLSVRPEVVFAADQNRVFPLERRTAGYGIVNVTASYTIGRQHAAHIITLNGYNLTDRLYRNHLSFIKDLVPEIGRGIRFGYTVRFF